VTTTVLALLDIGFSELLLCAVVALLLFGGRLPEAMGRFGSVYRGFRRGVDDLRRNLEQPPTPSRPAPRYRPAPDVPISQGVPTAGGEPTAPGKPKATEAPRAKDEARAPQAPARAEGAPPEDDAPPV
jgi:Sec-independent protein translocase protein TatA